MVVGAWGVGGNGGHRLGNQVGIPWGTPGPRAGFPQGCVSKPGPRAGLPRGCMCTPGPRAAPCAWRGRACGEGSSPDQGLGSCPAACGGTGSSRPGCVIVLPVCTSAGIAIGRSGGPREVREPGEVVFGEGVPLPALLLPAESLIRSCSVYSPLSRLVFSSQPAGPSFPFERERLF